MRKKASELKNHAVGTGGGPAKKWALTPFEERILAIMGRVAVHGIENVRIPFGVSFALYFDYFVLMLTCSVYKLRFACI